jgi:hypothetical protein
MAPNELSVHSMISVGITTTHNDETDQMINHDTCSTGGNFTWSKDNRQNYFNAITDNESIDKIISLENMLNDERNVNINLIVEK